MFGAPSTPKPTYIFQRPNLNVMYQHYTSKRYHKPEGRVNTQVSHKTETLGEILIASARIAQIHSYACAENTKKLAYG